jgi:hypothetical protein
MRRLLIACALLLPTFAVAQDFIRYYPPASSGADGYFADPGADGFVVRTALDTSTARTLTSPLGTLAVGNATGVAGNPTLDVDSSIMGQFATGAGSFGGTCTPGDWYYETDTFFATFCPVTDTGYTVVALAHASGTPTDDNTLVGSGTAWAKKAIPDCDDAGGNHLNYDTATNAFSCGTTGDGAGGGTPTLTSATLVEEFSSGGGTNGIIGTLGWRYVSISTGTSTGWLTTAVTNHPGIYRLTTGASDNAGTELYLLQMSGTDYQKDFDLQWIIRPSSAVTDSYFSVGIGGAGLAQTSAIRFVYDTDLSHATWIAQICDSATTGCQEAGDATNSDTVASTKAPVNGTWQRLRIRHLTSGVGGNPTYYFSVGDSGAMETELTFCSSGCDEDLGNLPTTDLYTEIIGVARAAGASKLLDLDYFSITLPSLTRY